jgi:hypothetical protein
MDLATLRSDREAIVDDASAALDRAHLAHYAAADVGERRSRLDRLFTLVVDCVEARDLIPIIDYATQVATERFHSGYGIAEVQTAFNVLEEAMWHHVVASVPTDGLAESIGLLTTVLGAGKDALARAYVSLASHTHVPTLDMTALFQAIH